MRRPTCQIEPNIAYAGETSTWRFLYTPTTTLSKGARIKFHLQSLGREIDWEIPQVDLKEKTNLLWGILPNGKTVPAKLIESKEEEIPEFEFVLPSLIEADDTFTICLGTPSKNKTQGSRAQLVTQRRRTFLLYVDPKGKGDYKEPEIFSFDVKGNELHHIQIIAPSIVVKNKRFDVLLRFEDAYGNLTNNTEEGTLIELSYEHLRENLSWKLFVPETGFLSLPNLYFNEPGLYRIQLQNLKTKQTFYSYPIQCFLEQEQSLFWGLLHGESDRVDSVENIETCLRHLRDEKFLQFFSTSPFESTEEISNDEWKEISHHVQEFNETGRFTTFLGMQWFSEDPQEGLRTFVFAKDNKAILRKKDSKNSHLKKIYKGLSSKELISIPAFTMAKGFGYDFSDFQPDFERVVEIYNAWGSSECTKKEGNPKPITGKKGVNEFADGSIQKALKHGLRFGFVAGGLDDRGIFSHLYDSDQVQYTPGLTAIFATDHTREALFQALYQRKCYATTGERILLHFCIAGAPMGSELSTKTKPGLCYNRHITGYVAGTQTLSSVEIVRNGEVLHCFSPKQAHLTFAHDDETAISQSAILRNDDALPFVYYYIRVTQTDGHMAWSSPIWIDIHETVPMKKSKKKT